MNRKLQSNIQDAMKEAWMLYRHSEGVLQVRSALDMVMCLWEPIWRSPMDSWMYRFLGKSNSVLALEGLAME